MEQEKVWDAIAGKWAEFRVRATDEVVDFLMGKEGRVLDLGCGSGRHGPLPIADSRLPIADKLGFYGVDFSERLLEFARGKGYVEVKKGYTWDVPYGDEFFDWVVFARVLHCIEGVEERRKSLEEVWRVLREGGEALITVWGRGSGRVKNREKEGFVPWSVDGEKFMRYTYVYDFGELESELVEVGFEIVRSWEDGCVGFVVRKN